MIAFWLWTYISILHICALPPEQPYFLPIRIGLAVDEKSVKDLLIMVNSAITTAYDKYNLVFHIVACGNDISEANKLVNTIIQSLSDCFPPTLQTEVVPFMLPRDSGFYLQMINAKKKHHWTSSTGADMARFYLASLFPTVDRILYVDNDVLITCCLEEIWATSMNDHQVIGIALDDLKWATVTQFNRQYNASHPLVAKNIRRNNNNSNNNNVIKLHDIAVSQNEFAKALPRYPNDGVILIDIKKYNHMKILDSINEIAMANGNGDYVVGLGTQQFTVLGMHDKWVELTPRANLRHFPDMARGYLMWFLYNGLIHFAGAAKPRQVCIQEGNVGNEHRVRTYVPWATNVFELHERCPKGLSIIQADGCWNHIPSPKQKFQFIDVIDKIIQSTKDPGLIYLKITDTFSNPDINNEKYHKSLVCLPKIRDYSTISMSIKEIEKRYASSNSVSNNDNNNNNNNIDEMNIKKRNMTKSSDSNRNMKKLIDVIKDPYCEQDLMTYIDRMILFGSSWSGRIYHRNNHSVEQTNKFLSSIKYSRYASLQTSYLNDLKRRPKSKTEEIREWIPIAINYCRYVSSFHPGNVIPKHDKTCISILDDIKERGKKHWDVMGISIDIPYNAKDLNDNSLSVLRALDLEFIRAKFILVKLYWRLSDHIYRDINETKDILHRNGFMILQKDYHVRKYDGLISAIVCGSFTSIFDFSFS